MKLKGFNIKNYRSIKNSGMNFLAHDNITALIGQNESGKTSVLEALLSFYNGKISDDILRSDMTWPEITCVFDFEGKNIFDFISSEDIPENLVKLLRSKNEISLLRKWKPDKSSVLTIIDEEVTGFYENIQNEKNGFERKIKSDINELLNNSDYVFKELLIAENERKACLKQCEELSQKLESLRKKLNKSKIENKETLENQFDECRLELTRKEEELNTKIRIYEEKKLLTEVISEKVSISRKYNETIKSIKACEEDISKLTFEMTESKHLYDICSNDREKRIASQRIEHVKNELNRVRRNFENLNEDLGIQKIMIDKVFSGISYRQAEAEAKAEVEKEKKYMSAVEIGVRLFKYVPVFDFFEDFSSLLPNKIDLEDILLENVNAEGFKAAKNFLIVAGLNPEFFREKNHRILKQKIENLNGEITINFQDYWSQSVGKNNKIKINFELEHYDYTVPEKSGKPYLEFWIKDKQERLYPKQRSRGVRWFLSFYLELKATAMQNDIKRVLLIDEPGLSLHARAQEDVLKVFEDLKDLLQIIYCTHSPHLVDINKIYRILAVQRADQEDENSESLVLDAKSLHNASTDTLSPIYSLMGAKLNQQQFINDKNNVLLQDPVTFYYLNSMAVLTGFKPDYYFIPVSGITGIQSISNLLTGWGVDFSMLFFGNGDIKLISEELKKELFIGNEPKAEKKIRVIEKYHLVEDLFSTIDFKKYVLQKREGITESNSTYIENNNLSRALLASSFINYLEKNLIKFSDFDDETRKNFTDLFNTIKNMF